ncbi:unnamed protein product [Blepharisma stoltei]|uniref:Uncharacterized protein n=1 Tax=Blepharisma stoltei TaxID=1481888 RepID=A0AAU9JIB4_9CILI|nr:unnamed protein product [Blepharisma stoltei]
MWRSENPTWKVSEPDKVAMLLRGIKHLASLSEIITFIVRPKRLDLFAESQDQSSALICTFESSFFNDYNGANRIFAIYSKNLMLITDSHKTSIINLQFAMRQEEFIDVVIDYNTGVSASYGCPTTDKIHDCCRMGGPEITIYQGWIGHNISFWDEKMMRLFPGSYDFFAIKITKAGIEVRNFDFEKNQTGTAGHPIKIPRAKIQLFSPLEEIEITTIPFPRLRSFMDSARKCRLGVQMSPEYSESCSQIFWQGFTESQNAYFSLLLGCEIKPISEKYIKPEETHDVRSVKEFRSIA